MKQSSHLPQLLFPGLIKTKKPKQNNNKNPLFQGSLWLEREAAPPLREPLVKWKSPTLLSPCN